MVRGERRALAGHSARADRRRHRACSRTGRAGRAGASPGQAGSHDPWLARRDSRRGCPPSAGAGDRLHRGVDGRAGEFDGVDGRLRDVERLLANQPRADGRRRQGRARPPARRDRDVLGRIGAGAGRRGRHRRARPAGHRARGRRRRSHAAARRRHCPVSRNGARGELEAAHRAYSVSVDGLQRAGHISDVLGCSITWPTSAARRAAWARRCAPTSERCNWRPMAADRALRGTADMYVGNEPGRLRARRPDAARQYLLQRASELGEHNGLPQNPYRWRVAMARVREAEGDLVDALGLLEEAERVYVGDFAPNVRPVAAVRARVLLAARPSRRSARLGARSEACRADDELSYLREFEHITLARMLLARSAAETGDRCERRGGAAWRAWPRRPTAGGGRGTSSRSCAAGAGRHAARRRDRRARAAGAALTLAEPEGYVRVFTGEGAPWPGC